MDEARGRADDLLFLAFGEHDALGLPAQPLEHPREHAGHRIEPCAQRLAVGVHVDDRLAGDAGIHGGLGDCRRHRRDQPRIERHRDDVFGPVFRPRSIGRRNLVRHVLARQLGERAGGRDLHLHVDGGGAHVECAAKDVGEPQHIVDLVRIVRAAGRHDGVVAHGRDFLGGDLGIRIGHGEDDGLCGHRLHHFGRHGAFR